MRAILSALLTALCGATASILPPPTYVFPAGQVNGTSSADTVVGQRAFDGPHITVANGSTFDGFYYDAFSDDSNAAVIVALSMGHFENAHGVLLTILWPNGSTYENSVPVGDLEVQTVGDGSQGYVEDGAMSWFGAPDLSAYRLTLNLPEIGVSGSITMRSRAPAHVACGLNFPGASLQWTSSLGYCNAVPDADASTTLIINGTRLSFKGSGYHDQLWGLTPYMNHLTQWYWGRISGDKYSVVFGYHIDEAFKVNAFAYIADAGNAIVSRCGIFEITPQGPGTSVPLKPGTDVESWAIRIHDPEHGEFAFTLSTVSIISLGRYPWARWLVHTVGGPVGGVKDAGTGIVEVMSAPHLHRMGHQQG
ncbi:hypothetical protein BJX96DRAFT_184297 [Aspergillus floccosus]